MKKSRREIIIALAIVTFLVLLGVLACNSVAQAAPRIPEATREFYVNDFAEIFSEKEKEELLEKAVQLAQESDGIQVIVTTVKTLDGYSVEEYANEMYNQYGIGKNDMGVLMLVATEDRQIRMEVGRAMESYINDSKAGRFLDKYAIPYLKNNKFSEGMINLHTEVIKYINSEIVVSNKVEQKATEVPKLAETVVVSVSDKSERKEEIVSRESSNKGGDIFMTIVLAIVCVILLAVLIANIVKRRSLQGEVEELKHEAWVKEGRYNQERNEFRNAVDDVKKEFEQKWHDMEVENSKLRGKYNNIEGELTTLKDRHERAKILHAGLDSAIDEMIEEEIRQKDMEAARKADEILEQALNMSVDKDNVQNFTEALNAYYVLTDSQKQYIKSDVQTLNENLGTARKLLREYELKCEEERARREASDVEERIKDIIKYINHGNANNFSKLKNAMSIYKQMSAGAKVYFNVTILNSLKHLLRQAKEDVERIEREEEERRRREQAERRRREEEERSSFSSFGGSSGGFGGFGGSSGGGGASRGF